MVATGLATPAPDVQGTVYPIAPGEDYRFPIGGGSVALPGVWCDSDQQVSRMGSSLPSRPSARNQPAMNTPSARDRNRRRRSLRLGMESLEERTLLTFNPFPWS